MRLTFIGADHEVTGSCHFLEACGLNILIDCGMEQGINKYENAELPIPYSDVDYVLVTHAHIDHVGLLPLIYARGFRGQIMATRATCDLCDIMLKDCAHIQESEAEWKNRKAMRAGKPEVTPIYTMNDAEGVLHHFVPCNYNEIIRLNDNLEIRFVDVGHLLGSASIEIWMKEDGVEKKIVFSGDIGNFNKPLIRDPIYTAEADYAVMESTYGNRNHTEVWSYTENLAKIIDDTMARGGNVVIPAFAVGRTQELLYFIREIKDKQLVKSNPDFPVYIDSPLARRATTIFTGDLDGYLDADALALVQDGTHMFNFSNLRMTETVEESKGLNEDGIPKVIISASGMCDAGRIRHHLKHNLWKPECTIVFVGYQGEGTLGRSLLEGVRSVKLFGEEIAVHAKIVNFQGLSSHADRDHLLAWIADIKAPKPQHVFIVHGDREVAPYFAESVEKLGFTAHAPQYTEVYDLLEDKIVAPGYLPERKAKAVGGQRVSSAYERLVALGQRMVDVIRRSKGRDNKTLGRWADQLRQLLDKWEES